LRLNEPACGAGGMVIAYADALQSAVLNYQDSMHAICVDIDARCVHMTYLQLVLLHITAIVVHGNALSMEEWSRWYTPAHIMRYGRDLQPHRSCSRVGVRMSKLVDHLETCPICCSASPRRNENLDTVE
jgi:hypothetical protein